MKKKLTALFLAVVMCMTLCIPAFADVSTEENTVQVELVDLPQPDETTQLIIDQQKPAVNAYQELMSHIEVIENNDYTYPDSYAGAYIDDSNKLCILLTDCSKEVIVQYSSYITDLSVVYFEEAEYSYNQLASVLDSIPVSDKSISCAYVDERTNVVKVGTPNGAIPASIANATDDLPVEWFYQECIPSASSLIGGEELLIGGSYYTLGVCGTYNGNDAILLCGHGLEGGEEVKLVGSSDYFAYVTAVQFEEGQSYDYGVANIYFNADDTATNKVYNASSSTTITSQMETKTPVGQIVCKYGDRSGFGTGEVTTNSLRWTDSNSGTTVRNITQCTYLDDTHVEGGDSGGPVYVGHVFHGTISGGTKTSGFFVFSPIVGVTGFEVKTS